MKEIKKSIFRHYDIRGIYPEEVNEEVACKLGRALARERRPKRVVVGRDMRIGSPELHKGLLRGFVEEGVDVDDIGMMPIDAMYFAVGEYAYDLGVMITASHNPKEYNGFKTVEGGMKWIRGDEVFQYVIRSGDATPEKGTREGTVTEKDMLAEYIAHVKSFIDVGKMRPLKIVIDAGNGMAGKVVPPIFKDLPFEVIPLFFELDGQFPNHPSNPLDLKAQIAARKKVLETKADVGVIIDGDADRIFFIDEQGTFTRADMTLLVIAKHMLQKNPGAGIAYNLICSRAVPEFIKKMGGRPIRTEVGYANVSDGMRDNDGVMGGELSGHYAFSKNHYADSGMISLLTILQVLSETGKKFSELIGEFSVYTKADEKNLKIEDKEGVIKKIKETYTDGEQDELDGITVEYPDWWFNVRPSNTEPLLRVTVEADSEELMKKKSDELVEFINKNA